MMIDAYSATTLPQFRRLYDAVELHEIEIRCAGAIQLAEWPSVHSHIAFA